MKHIATIALAAASFGLAMSQSQTTIYSPTRDIKAQGIATVGWGSGRLAQTTEVASEGAFSLRVQTKNFFQGGVLAFSNPVDLSKAFESKDQLFTINFFLPDSEVILGAEPAGGAAKKGGGAAGNPGAGEAETNTPSAQDKPKNKVVPLKTIRLIVGTTDGLKSEVYIPLESASGDKWKSIAIPLKAVTGFDRTNKIVKSIFFSGDSTAVFYLGAIEMVSDTTPITGELNVNKLDLALGDEVPLVVTAYGGATVLKYEWDFDESDGIQVEAEGRGVRRKFRKPGKYVVTCTVSDEFGLKKPIVLRLPVKVNG